MKPLKDVSLAEIFQNQVNASNNAQNSGIYLFIFVIIFMTSKIYFRFLDAETKRCITGDECIKLNKFIHAKDCVRNCPTNYMVKMIQDQMIPINHFCVPCLEKCPKICSNVPEISKLMLFHLTTIFNVFFLTSQKQLLI